MNPWGKKNKKNQKRQAMTMPFHMLEVELLECVLAGSSAGLSGSSARLSSAASGTPRPARMSFSLFFCLAFFCQL